MVLLSDRVARDGGAGVTDPHHLGGAVAGIAGVRGHNGEIVLHGSRHKGGRREAQAVL